MYWRIRLPEPPSGSTGIAISDGTVFVSGERLYGVDQVSSEVDWCRDLGVVRPSGPVLHGDTLVVGERVHPDDSGGVRAIDVTDGSDRWRNDDIGSIEARPTVDGGTAYVSGGIENPTVSAVGVDAGNLKWNVPVPGTARASPVPSTESLLVRTESQLVALDREDGTTKWRNDARPPVQPPVVVDETVFTQTGPSTFAAVAAPTGEIRWEVTDDTADDFHACADDQYVYVTMTRDGADRVAAFSQEDGAEQWSTTAQRHGSRYDVLGTPDSLYIAAEDGMIALRTTDGTTRWYRGFGALRDDDVVHSGTPSAFGVTPGAVYALTGSGDLVSVRR